MLALKNKHPDRPADEQRATVRPRKLSSRKRNDTTRISVWLDRESLQGLLTLQRFYLLKTGREVSYSLVVRRSLALLREHALDLLKDKDDDKLDAEARAIKKCR